MSAAAIELNDAGILIVGERGAAVSRRDASPGYALFDGDRLLTGLEAQVSARLKPRWINNRFWSDIGTEPLGRPFPTDLSHADLAHAHLSGLWKTWMAGGAGSQSALLVVPGSYSEQQLGLILGIARASEIPVSGLVDGAVIAADGQASTRMLHLDLQLHQAVLTELSRSGELVRGRVEIAPGAGLAAMQDLWARRIGSIFVRQTRFDPMHGATTEQVLYRRLSAWLEELNGQSSTYAVLESGSREYSVELTRAELVAAVEDRYRQLVDLVRRLKRPGEPTTLLLTHRVADLPDLAAMLGDLPDVRVEALPAGAAAGNALAKRHVIEAPGEALPFVTRLPGDRTVPPESAGFPADSPAFAKAMAGGGQVKVGPKETPTHILVDGRAFPIDERELSLGAAIPEGEHGITLHGNTAGMSRTHCRLRRRGEVVVVADQSRHGSYLNGDRFDGEIEVGAGDRLRMGAPGVEVQLIVVENGD